MLKNKASSLFFWRKIFQIGKRSNVRNVHLSLTTEKAQTYTITGQIKLKITSIQIQSVG
jgi:hypothetical protein